MRFLQRKTFQYFSFAVLLVVFLSGCSEDPAAPPGEGLSGGVLATFRMDGSGETFRVWITNQQAIEEVFKLQDGSRAQGFPSAKANRGSGLASHNSPWVWHMDPEVIEIVDNAIELCDGGPSVFTEYLDEYVDNVGRFCPWGAVLAGVDDRR